LPTGITLLSSGYLTGTATGYTSDSVVTFTLVVTDVEGQAAQQNYSYTVFIGDTYFKQTSLLLSADTANTFISDSSTNNFLVSRFGDTRPSRFSPYWPGGWSGYFDGSGDFLSFTGTSALALTTSTTPFTYEFWIYPVAAGGAILSEFYNGSFDPVVLTITMGDVSGTAGSTGGLYPTISYFDGGWSNRVYSSVAISLSTWTHVAFVFSGSVTKVYINGTDRTTGTLTSYQTATGTTWYIGRRWDTNPTEYYTGYISNFRYVKGTALYTANFTPSTTSLTTVANTALLTLRDPIIADDSPNNVTLTRNGDTRLTTFSPFNTVPYTLTANSNSVYFDGTGDNLTIADNDAFEFGSGQFTIECWVYPNSLKGYQGIVSKVGAADQNGWVLYFETTNTINYLMGNGTWTVMLSGGSTVAAGQWSHIAVTKDASNVYRMFVNGQQVGTTTNAFTLNQTSGLFYIGKYPYFPNYANTMDFGGHISNIRILKGTALYTANFTPSTTALTAIANTSLLTCQSTTVVDNSSNNFAITVNGNPNVSIVNPFGETVSTISNYTWSANSYSASGYFDGTGDYLTVANNSAFIPSNSDFTYEVWVYPTATPATYNSIFYKRATNGYAGVGLSVKNTGVFSVLATSADGVWNILNDESSIAVTLNAWQHIAITRQGSSWKVFKDGVLRITATSSATVRDTGSNQAIGAGSQTGDQPFSGYISNFRFVKGTALYTGPFIPPAAPLTTVANTSILTLQTDVGSNSSQFVDQSAQNNLITRNGNASQGAYSPLVPSTWSAYFDGTGDYLSIARNTNLIPVANEDFTFEAWVYVTATPGVTNAHIMGFHEYGTSSDWILSVTSSLQLSLYTVADTTPSPYPGYTNTVANISLNSWTHVAASRSGTGSNNFKLFVNGIGQSFSTNSTLVGVGNNNFSIGADQNGDESNFTGYISNLRILKGTAQYTANFTPSTTTIGPVANTSLLTLREPILADNSGNNFTIFRNGDVKIVPFGPFSPQTVTPDSYSYRFSNASDYISTTNSNLALGTNDWTVESWVYPRFTANSGIFQISNVQYGLTNSNLNTVALGFSSGNKAIVRVANATYTSTGTTITANAWTHLALVKSSNVSKLYINGTLDSTLGTSGSITDNVNYTGTTNIAVGGYGSTSALANAYISNFRVVSNSAVYTSNFTVNVGPLTAVNGTTLLTCQANTIVDGSSANLSITANANVTPSKFNPFDETVTVGQTYSGASAGGSVYLDGSSDYLTLPTNTATALGSSNFTIECWIYFTNANDATNHHGIYTNYTSFVAGSLYYGKHPSNSGYVAVWIYNVSSSAAVLTESSFPPNNSWTHYALVRNGTSLRLYRNGSLSASATVSANVLFTGTSNPSYIGVVGDLLSTGALQGYMSGFRIMVGTALYTTPFVPPAAPALPTTANTSLLLNFTSSGVVDATGRNVLETVNDARVVTSTYKYGSGSYYFDGTGDYLSVASNDLFNFGTGDFTIEVWAYINSINIYAGFIDTRTLGATLQNWVFGVHASGGNKLDFIYGSTRLTSAATVSTGQWTHFAVTRSSGTIRLFINGVVDINTATYTSAINASRTQPVVGAVIDPYYLNGYIDDLRITNGYARYTANFTAPTAPFVTK
jgi:hypothetical protein